MTNGLYKDMSGKILKRFLLDRPELYSSYLKARTSNVQGGGEANGGGDNGNDDMSANGDTNLQGGGCFNTDNFFAEEG